MDQIELSRSSTGAYCFVISANVNNVQWFIRPDGPRKVNPQLRSLHFSMPSAK